MILMFVRNLEIGERLLWKVFIKSVIIIKGRNRNRNREQIEVEFKEIRNLIINRIKLKLNRD